MSDQRWRRIEEICHQALEHSPNHRPTFVSEACAGDEALRRDVESLLANQSRADALGSGVGSRDSKLGIGTQELIGKQIGVYRIDSLLGAGGMGEVYRARDTKLRREVAIKILPRSFTNDPDRMARFEREARMLAALNHPNIGAIYGLEEVDGIQALVLELIPGPTLAESVARGPLPLKEAIRIAGQIVEGLDNAHEKGIIHRDLKPSNIKITPEGVVKILDFGLARVVSNEENDAITQAPTATGTLTQEGMIMGTAAYMSPEQARGHALDKRTDIWALGCVLFEMLTGRPVFHGATSRDILAAVIERTPDWSLLPPATPANIERALRRCLEKDPRKRIRDMGDLSAEFEDATFPAEGRGAPRESNRKRTIAAAVGTLVLAAAAVAAIALWRRPGADREERRVQFELTIPQQGNDINSGTTPMPSPDGQLLAFIASDSNRPVVWVQPLDSIKALPLPGTEGAEGAVIWSPDGRWLGFFADGRLKKVAPSGGPPQTIATIPGFQDAAWGTSGEIIFRPRNRAAILGISETGGGVKTITELNAERGENSHRFLQFLPDGRRFLFTARSVERQNNALFVGSIDSLQVTRVMEAQSRVSYVPSPSGDAATLLFYKDGALMARSFSLARMEVGPEPSPVFDKISYVAASIYAGFSASADGRTVVVEPAAANDDQMTWFNRDGTIRGTLGVPGDYLQLRLSPSGDRVAYTKPDDRSGNRDIWYSDIARGNTARVTANGANDWWPVWSADGKRLIFQSDRDGAAGGRPYLKSSIDISGDESIISEGKVGPWDWTRDGQWFSSGGDGDLWIQELGTGKKPFRFLGTSFIELGGRFSPDGLWIAYVSKETGRREVFVRPFAGAPASPDGKLQVSNGGGDYPAWRADGQELYFMSGDFNIHAVDTRDLNRASRIPTPTRLFKACPNTAPYLPPLTGQTFGYAFDTHDGQQFLVNCRVHPAGRYFVLLNPLLSLSR